MKEQWRTLTPYQRFEVIVSLALTASFWIKGDDFRPIVGHGSRDSGAWPYVLIDPRTRFAPTPNAITRHNIIKR